MLNIGSLTKNLGCAAMPITSPTKIIAEADASQTSLVAAGFMTVQLLTETETSEVQKFLGARPLHTVIMAGLIRDNGLVSPLNRGTFYACRNEEGGLEGVTLIGEITLLETRVEAALPAFARLAQEVPNIYMVMAEREKVEGFWRYYAAAGQTARLCCRELLLELRWPVEMREPVPGLRAASLNDLEPVMAVHAEMAQAESGLNPLHVDPIGFRQRCARRIEQGRVWVLTNDEGLIFKVDIISETPDVVYLEGLYVNAEARGHGHGVRCLSQLSRDLLFRAKSICLMVNDQNREAQALYRKCNFKPCGSYDTIFLQQDTDRIATHREPQ
jgi:predicted GNAT family acetyltransferase